MALLSLPEVEDIPDVLLSVAVEVARVVSGVVDPMVDSLVVEDAWLVEDNPVVLSCELVLLEMPAIVVLEVALTLVVD